MLVVGVLFGACGGDDQSLQERQAEVADRSAEVMPFDLDATTHRFEPTATGLVETVVADDRADDEQIKKLIGQVVLRQEERARTKKTH